MELQREKEEEDEEEEEEEDGERKPWKELGRDLGEIWERLGEI